MVYAVKEMFLTLQGEGMQAGRPAVFCRFAGCNLWSGLEKDRASAACSFCDTDFIGTDGKGGGRFATSQALVEALVAIWGKDTDHRFVVFTGGEPLLQLDAGLIEAVKSQGFDVAVETNGTLPAPPGIDWICVSPKGRETLIQRCGQELKLVFPQADAMPAQFEHLDFEHFLLQPMDSPELEANIKAALAYCLASPRWRLSLQTHKLLGIR